jgi:hypothetical protein
MPCAGGASSKRRRVREIEKLRFTGSSAFTDDDGSD